MAHYKRGKCRYHGKTRHCSETFIRRRRGLKPVVIPDGPPGREWHPWWQQHKRIFWPSGAYHWYSTSPAWHDILHHSRPRRSKEKRLEKAILAGRIEADEAMWPLSKRPHIWYW